MKPKTSITILLASSFAIGVGLGAGLISLVGNAHLRESEAAAAQLRDYCLQVHVSVDMDARDLASDNPKRQQLAADRFSELVTFHSAQEIAMCSATPPNLEARDGCWLKQDYACLADMAKAATAATSPR